jgi:glycosyltransferase involved in cell wall biosynthesis
MKELRRASVAVLMPTLNRPGNLKNFLDSLVKQTVLPERMVVIDQSDDDRTRQLFESYPLGSIEKVYVRQTEKSLIKARNNGLDHSGNTEFLCFFDDDIILLPNYFEIILQHFEKDVAKKYAGGMGTMQGPFPKDPLTFKIFRHSHHGDGKFMASKVATWPWKRNEFTEVEFLSGGLTFYRSEIIKKFRWDERLIGYGHGDDVDVSYRLSRQYKMFYEPAAVCIHNHVSSGRDNKRKHRQQWLQNMYYLHQKNGGFTLQSRLAYTWFVLGYFVYDFLSRSYSGVTGDMIGIYKVLTGKIDSVAGYRDFLLENKRK